MRCFVRPAASLPGCVPHQDAEPTATRVTGKQAGRRCPTVCFLQTRPLPPAQRPVCRCVGGGVGRGRQATSVPRGGLPALMTLYNFRNPQGQGESHGPAAAEGEWRQHRFGGLVFNPASPSTGGGSRVRGGRKQFHRAPSLPGKKRKHRKSCNFLSSLIKYTTLPSPDFLTLPRGSSQTRATGMFSVVPQMVEKRCGRRASR